MHSDVNNVEKITLLIDFTGVGMVREISSVKTFSFYLNHGAQAMAGIDNTKISIEVLNILQNHYPEVSLILRIGCLKN